MKYEITIVIEREAENTQHLIAIQTRIARNLICEGIKEMKVRRVDTQKEREETNKEGESE